MQTPQPYSPVSTRKPRRAGTPTYQTFTQSFTAKVVDPTKLLHSLSGDLQASSRPRTPSTLHGEHPAATHESSAMHQPSSPPLEENGHLSDGAQTMPVRRAGDASYLTALAEQGLYTKSPSSDEVPTLEDEYESTSRRNSSVGGVEDDNEQSRVFSRPASLISYRPKPKHDVHQAESPPSPRVASEQMPALPATLRASTPVASEKLPTPATVERMALPEKLEHGLVVQSNSSIQRSYAEACSRLAQAFGVATAEVITVANINEFRNFIAHQRLQTIPHQGGILDRCFERALTFAIGIRDLARAVPQSDSASDEAVRLTWSCIKRLTEAHEKSLDLLDKVFDQLEEVTATLQYFTTYHRRHGAGQSSSKLTSILVQVLVTVTELCSELTFAFGTSTHEHLDVILKDDFATRFSPFFEKIYRLKSQYTIAVWESTLDSIPASQGSKIGLETILKWLRGYSQSSSGSFAYGLGKKRDELTCQWFRPIMRDFFNDSEDVLVVSGHAGCGKSLLSGFILDSVRTIDTQRKKVLSFTIDPLLPNRRTPIQLIKSLLLQFLDKAIGDIELYRALSSAYIEIEERHAANEESILWKVFEDAASRQTSEMLIVIDGLDQIEGGHTVSLRITAQLKTLMTRQRTFKCIILSRPFYDTCPPGIHEFTIDDSTIAKDIHRYLEIRVKGSPIFSRLTVREQDTILHLMLERSFRSFLEAKLFFQVLEFEQTYAKIIRAIEGAPRSIRGLHEFLLLRLDTTNRRLTALLSWLLVATNPLSLTQLKEIGGSRVGGTDISAPLADKHEIRKVGASLIEIQGEIVQFSHPSVKDSLESLCREGKFPINLEDAHMDAALSCLALIKAQLSGLHLEPVFGDGASAESTALLHDKIQKSQSLDYAVCSYLIHYKKSSLHDDKVSARSLGTLKSYFPDYVALAILEKELWKTRFHGRREQMFALVLSIRKALFGSGESIVQSIINLAEINRKSSSTAAMSLYYEAWELSQVVFGHHSTICRAAAEMYLEIFGGSVVSPGESLPGELESIYKFLWEVSRTKIGATSSATLRYAELLAEFYASKHRHERACSIWRELYDTCIKQRGALHELTIKYSEHLIKVLQKLGKFEEAIRITEIIFRASERTFEVWDRQRISATLRFVRNLELRGSRDKAEATIRELWQALFGACRMRIGQSVEVSTIDVSIEYAHLLVRLERTPAARDVLIEQWRLYESILVVEIPADAILAKLRVLAELLISVEEHESATTVLERLRSWYDKSLRSTSEEAVLVAVALARCYHEKRDLANSETLLRDLFDILVRSSTTHVTTITVCLELAALYDAAGRWAEAIAVSEKLLARVWGSILVRGDHTEPLPSGNRGEAIQLAVMLATLHLRAGRMDLAESIQIYIYRAHRLTFSLDDDEIVAAAERLTGFYESIKMIEKSINTWKELRDDCYTKLGRKHTVSVRVAYILARLCQRHSIDTAEEALEGIIWSFGDDSDACNPSSIDAVLELLALYEKQRRVDGLRKWYLNIWNAFKERGSRSGLDGDRFFDIFVKYLQFLREHQSDTEAIRLAVDFRDYCNVNYGSQHLSTIRASFELASLLAKDISRREEAIRIFEEIRRLSLDFSGDQDAFRRLIKLVREQLGWLYTQKGNTADKAETIYVELLQETKRRLGCSHPSALSHLKELVEFYRKRGNSASTTAAISVLETTVVEILGYERDSHKLFDCANTLAELYISLDARVIGLGALSDVRLCFSGAAERSSTRSIIIKLRQDRFVDRRCFVFVMALERMLKDRSKPILLGDIMDDLMTETSLYESWIRALCYKSDLESCLSIGAKLLAFLQRHERQSERDKIQDEMWAIFCRELGAESNKSGILWGLFEVCLTEIGREGLSVPLLEAAVQAVIRYRDAAQFQQCYELAKWITTFVEQRGGFSVGAHSALGFRLAVCLVGVSSGGQRASGDLAALLKELSSSIVIQVLSASGAADYDVGSLSEAEINVLIIQLGAMKDYSNLEQILQNLWTSRTHRSWTYKTIITIGQRLCEVRFAAGRHAAALALLDDICYNLQSALGRLDPLTLASEDLLSRLHVACGQHSHALAVHEGVLAEVLAEHGARGHATGVDALDLRAIALEQARRLKLARQRGVAAGAHRDDQRFKSLLGQLADAFDDGDERWGDLVEPNRWDWHSVPPKAETFGYWEAPPKWKILDDDEETQIDGHNGMVI